MAVSEAIENYLETIYILSHQQNEVHAIDICTYLSYSRPTVSIVLRQMRENGLVTVNEDNHIHLTEEGLAIASRIYERHTVLSELLMSLGVRQVATHAGFIPENPHDPQYAGMIDAIREVAQHMKDNGQSFLFETGQETPVTLLRAIEDVGTGNLGINLDTANLILYGKAHPLDALEILGRYVMDVHVKDGCWPTDGWRLGRETPLGEGLVNFPLVMKKLKALGYDGALTIEREISGEKKTEDILRAKAMLENLMD